jgi:RNA polymerase sigma-70 factor, ECF subfamily
VVVGWVARMGVPSCDRADVAQDALRRATESWPTFRADYPTSAHAKGCASAGAEGATSEPSARAIPSGAPPVLFLRWLNSITRHAVWHYYDRAYQKHEELAEEPLDPETPDPAPIASESLTREQERLRVIDALQALPAYECAVLIAHDIDGISMQDIAEHLGLPTSTAYKVHARARAALGKEIARREAEEREADERSQSHDEEVACAPKHRVSSALLGCAMRRDAGAHRLARGRAETAAHRGPPSSRP